MYGSTTSTPGRVGGLHERLRRERARRERLRMKFAIREGYWTIEQERLLGILVEGALGWNELIARASSGAKPSRSINEAIESLMAQGVVGGNTTFDLCITDPSEWLGEAALRRIAAEVERQSEDVPAPEAVLGPGQFRVIGIPA